MTAAFPGWPGSGPQRAAADRAPAGLQQAPLRAADRTADGAADAQPLGAGSRGFRGDRAAAAVAAAGRLGADHRRGRPHHGIRARIAQPRGLARRPLGARPAAPRRAGAGGACPGQRTGRPHRLRPRRRREHRAARLAADGSGPPACTARRFPPHRKGLRAHHRTDRQRVPRVEARRPGPAHCTGWKAQHRFAAALPDAFVPNAVGTAFTFAESAA